MSKNALVINGGISRGAFAVGVIHKLFEIHPQVQFDILVGTGAGSLITPFVALGESEPLVEIFTTKNNKDIVRKFALADRLHESSILDAGPFWGLLDQYYTHSLYNRLQQTKKELFFNTYCLQTHELTVFSDKIREDLEGRFAFRTFNNYDQFLRTLMACSCQPLLMPPITIHPTETPIRQYIDAGDRDFTAIELAIAAGATDVYVILMSPPGPVGNDSEYHDLYSILQQTLEIFIADGNDNQHIGPHVYNEGLRYIQAVKQKMLAGGIPQVLINEWFDPGMPANPFYKKEPVNIHVVRPEHHLGGGPDGLSFDPGLMREMLAQGESATLNWFTRHAAMLAAKAAAAAASTASAPASQTQNVPIRSN